MRLPVADLSAEISRPLRPYLEAAVEEMAREIHRSVPEFSRPLRSRHGQRMQRTINETVRSFVEAIENPGMDWRPLINRYVRIGAHEARNGRGLAGLQTAIWVAGQVASRRFVKDARRLGWSLEVLGLVNESLLVFLERISNAVAQGHAGSAEDMATDRERLRGRLRDLLVAEPAPSAEAIMAMAGSAGWTVPRTIAAIAVQPPPGSHVPVLPPTVLADWDCPQPYLVVAAPGGPGPDALADNTLDGIPAAIGPAVEPTRGAVSLRWARRALTLMDLGVIDAKRPVRVTDHVARLLTAHGAELLSLVVDERLKPLRKISSEFRRLEYARTLLVYLQCQGSAVATAERLRVHEQTVRYRLRRLEALLGGLVHDPGCRTEMLLVLTLAVEFGHLGDQPMNQSPFAEHDGEPVDRENGTALTFSRTSGSASEQDRGARARRAAS